MNGSRVMKCAACNGTGIADWRRTGVVGINAQYEEVGCAVCRGNGRVVAIELGPEVAVTPSAAAVETSGTPAFPAPRPARLCVVCNQHHPDDGECMPRAERPAREERSATWRSSDSFGELIARTAGDPGVSRLLASLEANFGRTFGGA